VGEFGWPSGHSIHQMHSYTGNNIRQRVAQHGAHAGLTTEEPALSTWRVGTLRHRYVISIDPCTDSPLSTLKREQLHFEAAPAKLPLPIPDQANVQR